MEEILLDTDILIDFLRGHSERIRSVFSMIEEGKLKGYISIVTIVELYAGEDPESKGKRESLEKLLSFFECIYLEHSIALVAGKLKRRYQIGLGDSIIAATSFTSGIPLFTFNTKHFEKIEEVKIFNPV